jgi:hypothetical protein
MRRHHKQNVVLFCDVLPQESSVVEGGVGPFVFVA